MDSVLEEFLNLLSPLENFRVVRFPDIILLCGGPAHEEESISFRNYLKKQDPMKPYLLPESIKEWNNNNTYSDLLSFEEDLGSIISSVVLFLESEGAIAELGAFSRIASISNKLLVIVDSRHYNIDSFIKLGPIKFLENENEKAIIVCDFLNRGAQAENSYIPHVEGIKKEITDFLKVTSEANFLVDKISHVSLLIYEILTYFNILSTQEIKKVLEFFSITADKSILNRSFFLLKTVGLIDEFKYMHTVYYIPLEMKQHIKLVFNAGKYIDKAKHAQECFAKMQINSDDEKTKALNSYSKKRLS